jgi:2-keto-4-pentenoate hydratase/2-oxohepta-3-ene-1,7-dioic acid hydratase in catechol pathway
MTDIPFRLGSFAAGRRRFVGLVLGDHEVFDLPAAQSAYLDSPRGRAGRLSACATMLDLLEDWDAAFPVLQAIADFVQGEGRGSDRLRGAAHPMGALHVLPPVLRPSKMLYAAANYREHVAGMRKTFSNGLPAVDRSKDATGDRARSRPYCFAKAPSCLAGAFDDIVLPPGMERIDWEAELGVVIGRQGKNIPAEKAMDHVAGFVTTNDVSCRDRTWREDRPGVRSDWIGGKSWDTFAPTGPFLVPRAFVPDHANLRILCLVNGETKQDGNSGDMTFNTEEQIAYAAAMLTLEPGDMLATGTPAGTGQERLEFLKPGDVVETEVVGLGRMRNRVVAGSGEYGRGIDAPR